MSQRSAIDPAAGALLVLLCAVWGAGQVADQGRQPGRLAPLSRGDPFGRRRPPRVGLVGVARDRADSPRRHRGLRRRRSRRSSRSSSSASTGGSCSRPWRAGCCSSTPRPSSSRSAPTGSSRPSACRHEDGRAGGGVRRARARAGRRPPAAHVPRGAGRRPRARGRRPLGRDDAHHQGARPDHHARTARSSTSSAGSAIILAALALASGEAGVTRPTGPVVAAVLYQIVAVAFASYLAWFWLLTRYPASHLHAYTFWTPLFGLGGGVAPAGRAGDAGAPARDGVRRGRDLPREPAAGRGRARPRDDRRARHLEPGAPAAEVEPQRAALAARARPAVVLGDADQERVELVEERGVVRRDGPSGAPARPRSRRRRPPADGAPGSVACRRPRRRWAGPRRTARWRRPSPGRCRRSPRSSARSAGSGSASSRPRWPPWCRATCRAKARSRRAFSRNVPDGRSSAASRAGAQREHRAEVEGAGRAEPLDGPLGVAPGGVLREDRSNDHLEPGAGRPPALRAVSPVQAVVEPEQAAAPRIGPGQERRRRQHGGPIIRTRAARRQRVLARAFLLGGLLLARVGGAGPAGRDGGRGRARGGSGVPAGSRGGRPRHVRGRGRQGDAQADEAPDRGGGSPPRPRRPHRGCDARRSDPGRLGAQDPGAGAGRARARAGGRPPGRARRPGDRAPGRGSPRARRSASRGPGPRGISCSPSSCARLASGPGTWIHAASGRTGLLAQLGSGDLAAAMVEEPWAGRLLAADRAGLLVDFRQPAEVERVLGGPFYEVVSVVVGPPTEEETKAAEGRREGRQEAPAAPPEPPPEAALVAYARAVARVQAWLAGTPPDDGGRAPAGRARRGPRALRGAAHPAPGRLRGNRGGDSRGARGDDPRSAERRQPLARHPHGGPGDLAAPAAVAEARRQLGATPPPP